MDAGERQHLQGLAQERDSGDGVTKAVEVSELGGRKTVDVVPGDRNTHTAVTSSVPLVVDRPGTSLVAGAALVPGRK